MKKKRKWNENQRLYEVFVKSCLSIRSSSICVILKIYEFWVRVSTRAKAKYLRNNIDNVKKLIDKDKSKRVVDDTKHTKIIWEIVTSQRNELRILQYNVHKSRNKMIITLLNEKKIKNYDILIIQKLWRFNENFKTYYSTNVDFTLTNNENKTCFYINKKIDNNN